MPFLTKSVGRFPIGIWIVLIIFIVAGLLLTLFAQGLSVVSWKTALAMNLQEDSPDSTDPAERALGAVSQGEAVADVIVQGTLILITLVGIVRRKP